jgi:hypothetical protein
VPSLISTNILSPVAHYIEPIVANIYYRNVGVDPNTMVPFDGRFSFRAGDPHATADQSPVIMDWSCVANRVDDEENEVNFGQTIPQTCPKYLDGDEENPFMLRLVVYFPNCLDKDTAVVDNGQWKPRDWAYAVKIDDPDPELDFKWHCADEGYEAVPQVQVGVRWPLDPADGIVTDPSDSTKWDLSSLKLTSDMMMGQDDGISGHADFMSGWTDAELLELMKTCFWDSSHGGYTGSPRNCGAIGDDDTDYDPF